MSLTLNKFLLLVDTELTSDIQDTPVVLLSEYGMLPLLPLSLGSHSILRTQCPSLQWTVQDKLQGTEVGFDDMRFDSFVNSTGILLHAVVFNIQGGWKNNTIRIHGTWNNQLRDIWKVLLLLKFLNPRARTKAGKTVTI